MKANIITLLIGFRDRIRARLGRDPADAETNQAKKNGNILSSAPPEWLKRFRHQAAEELESVVKQRRGLQIEFEQVQTELVEVRLQVAKLRAKLEANVASRVRQIVATGGNGRHMGKMAHDSADGHHGAGSS